MRALAGVCCAGALFALLGSGTRAQDYNKTMTFTFNDSVQVPGMTLEPGTYMFKLADPESGRRTVQVWNKDGSKMYTMALTTVDRRLNVPDPTKIKDGLVMFGEQPAGTPMAIRTWFYTGDTIGYEFVYPKDQAMTIAKAYHTPVLATNDASTTDAAILKGAKVGRIDENGQFTDDASSSVTASAATPSDQSATSSSTTASSTTTTASTASSTSTASAASTTTAPAEPAASKSTTASTTTADRAPITADASTTAPATTAAAEPAPAPRAFETATVQEPQPVGTTGQATSARATDTAPQTANAKPLPQTASPLATMALLSAICLLSAVAMRQRRRRYAHDV